MLDRAEESNPGFSGPICAALHSRAAVDDLTLRDLISHATLVHPDERAVECPECRIDGEIQSMVRTMSRERGVCAACIRAATAGWVAMTVSCDLGLGPFGPTGHAGETWLEATRPKWHLTARSRPTTKLRVARRYEEFNSGRKTEPDDLHETAMGLLDHVGEFNPGFCERMAEVLAAENLEEAVLGLTVGDIKSHTTMWHVDDRIVGDTAGSDYLWRDIYRLVEATSEECGLCASCDRAVVVGWIARTMVWDLGPRTTPDPLMVPKDDGPLLSAAL